MDGDANGDKLHEIYHTGLRNMHALEMTAIELTERQIERLENYPETAARLRQHHAESQQQAKRIEDILARHDTNSSSLKNTVTAVMGNVAAALHAPASDEILKNTFANFAFEHQEIAAYTSLIAMAEKIGDIRLATGAKAVTIRGANNGRLHWQSDCSQRQSALWT